MTIEKVDEHLKPLPESSDEDDLDQIEIPQNLPTMDLGLKKKSSSLLDSL